MLDYRFAALSLVILAHPATADDKAVVDQAVQACRRLGIQCETTRAKVYRLNPPTGNAVYKVRMTGVEVELDESGRAWSISDRTSSSKSFSRNPAQAFALFGLDVRQYDVDGSWWGKIPHYTLRPRSHGYPSLVEAAHLRLDPKTGSIAHLNRSKPVAFDPPTVSLTPREAASRAVPVLKRFWETRKTRSDKIPFPSVASFERTSSLMYATCYTNATRLARRKAGNRARLAFVFQNADYRLLLDAETGDCLGAAWLNSSGGPLSGSSFPMLGDRN